MKDGVKLAGVLVLVAGAAIAFVSLREGKGYGLQRGQPVPSFSLTGLDGHAVDLATQRGKVVILNFWATWCPPCVEEMPSLERLHRTLGPEGLVVISVSVDEDEATLREFVTKHGVTFPVLRDPSRRVANDVYRTTGFPETFVIDAAGVLREKFIGPAEWSTPAALDHFRGILTQRPK
jgi:cytochrome c biogenesis protein CcmG, thiol:disulfide interchange protein DsbE